MKVLVGSDTEYYRGNILYLNREAPDRLVITSEADRDEPLLYALRQAYTNLDVEIKETEWWILFSYKREKEEVNFEYLDRCDYIKNH